MSERFDAVVVGAGPAGSAAAMVLGRAGYRVALVERGPFPGSKNVYGGVVYGRVLDALVPRWWEEAPVQRWVTRRATMVLAGARSMTLDYRNDDWGRPPYNGATAYRADFDAWLARKASEAGAVLVPATTVVGLVLDGGRVAGVRTDRPDGEIAADVVIAADGVNSLLAKEAGLYPPGGAERFTLGVKEVWELGREEIDHRFGLEGRQGADFEVLGGTGEVSGGGFLYTNLSTVSVGVVVRPLDLVTTGRRPEELVSGLREHPSVARLVRGGELVEYSAHLIPEGGWDFLPRLVGDGLLVCGDAAALCLAAGLWLEGVNFAIGSGAAAGRAAAEALQRGDTSATGLAGYPRRLAASFVLADHRRLRRLPQLVLSDRVQHRYPALVCSLVEGLFAVENPTPKKRLSASFAAELRRAGLRHRDVATDTLRALRSLL